MPAPNLKPITLLLAFCTLLAGGSILAFLVAVGARVVAEGPPENGTGPLIVTGACVLILAGGLLLAGVGYLRKRSAKRAGSVVTACGFLGWFLSTGSPRTS